MERYAGVSPRDKRKWSDGGEWCSRSEGSYPLHSDKTPVVTDERCTRLAWLVFILITALYVLSFVIHPALFSRPGASSWNVGVSLIFAVLTFSFPVVGILILSRQPRNTIGWLLLTIGFFWALPADSYREYALSRGLDHAAAIADAFSAWLWAPPVGIMGTFLILLFPDGRFASPRWKKVGWFAGFAIVVASLTLFLSPGKFDDGTGLTNPFGVRSLKPVLDIAIVSIAFIPLSIAASAISLIQRFRRSKGVERLRLKWLVTAIAGLAIVSLVTGPGSLLAGNHPPTWVRVAQSVTSFAFFLIPAAIGIAILRYRLYDINVVINKTLVFGSLAAFITAVYVAIVVGIGTIFGSGDKPNLALSIAATAVVAIAFQPVRERIQRLANRLVYGERATPYEVLTRFSRSLGALVSVEDVLPQIARHTAQGLGAEVVVVTTYLEHGKKAASYPQDAPPQREPDEVIPVTYRNEAVGDITLTKPGSEPFTGQERKLLGQLAAHAGVVLHNYRLAVELRARLDELSAQAEDLRDSRERLVSAADTSRRVVERAIRAGVERRLVAIAEDLGTASDLMASDSHGTATLLERLGAVINDTLEALRDLARGIYPPLLADKGLVMALEAHLRKTASQATLLVDDDVIERRFDRTVETACYFCLREALENVARHADGAPTTVTLERRDQRLMFSVHDEGPGFEVPASHLTQGLQSMSDRVAASGGDLTITSAPGRGTTVSGWVPLVMEEDLFQEAEAAAQASSS
ncbi:MAG: hypothetical protein M3P18_05875 [Actinomycetota bacterium]|nr:hypothetical protein [Actinomycetota bacterium]